MNPEGDTQPSVDVVLRCTASSLQSDGLYLLYSPLTLILWVGRQVSPQALTQLFNTTSFLSLTSGEVKARPAAKDSESVKLCCVVLLSVSITSTFHVVALQIKPPELGNPLCFSLQKLISTLQYYAAVTLQVGLLIIIMHV